MDGATGRTRATVERSLPDGSRWRSSASGAARRFELVPKRRAAIPRLALAVAWIGLMAAMILSVSRGRGFFFLPIVIVPFKRYYLALCASFNRLTFTVADDRVGFRQGPLPCGRAFACATDDLANVRAKELDEYVGWFADGDERWSSVLVAQRDGTRIVLPFRVGDVRTAAFIADALNDAVQTIRAPRAYRA